MTYLLASASPRRKALMEQIGLTPLRVLPADIDESSVSAPNPRELVKKLAFLKGEALLPMMMPGEVIVAADTVVVADGIIMGKPSDEKGAFSMLSRLSGRTHQVYTGLAVLSADCQISETVTSHVTFRSLSPEEILSYIATGEPLDKAGAYGIQGKAAAFVSRLEGDYFAVMGLPLCRLSEILKDF